MIMTGGFVPVAFSHLTVLLGNTSDMTAQSLFTQLGVFAVVIAVFRYMLSRSDAKDAQTYADDKKLREALHEELSAERAAHDVTRQLLYDALLKNLKHKGKPDEQP
jgi:hypothetical protein